MGIFSSKTVITVGTSISPLITEKPNLARSAILRASFNDWEYTPTIIDALLSGYNIDPRGYYNYGKNKYYYKLPEGHIPQLVVRDEELLNVLASLNNVLPSAIEVIDTDYDTYDETVAGNWFLVKQGDLDIKTGLISNLPFIPDGEVARIDSVSINEKYIDNDGLSVPEIVSVAVSAQITHFNPNTPEQTTQIEHFERIAPEDINLLSFFNKAYNTTYKILDETTGEYSTELYFIYDPELNTYPELNVFEEEDLDSPYYPIVPIRKDKEWVDETFPAYETSVKILNYLSVDMHAIQDALRDNPDVDDVDDSFILLGMPIGKDHDRDSIDCKYLYRYFEYLASISKVDKEKFESSLSGKRPAFNVIDIRDTGFRTSLYWNYVESREFDFYSESRAGTYELKHFSNRVNARKTTDKNFYSKDHIEIWYHNEATKKVDVIKVSGLYHVSDVYFGKKVINTITSVFTPIEDERTDGFFLPLSEDIMNTLSKREYTHVAFSSLILLNYAVIQTKLKWYQREAFWRLVQVIIIIISIFTIQPQLAALATATVSEIAYLVVQSIVVNYLIGEAIGYVLGLLAEVIGGEAAVLIAVIAAAVAAIYGAGGQFNLKLPFADEILKISNLMLTEIQKLQNQRAKQLQEEITSFRSEYEALKEEIDAAQDLLGTDGYFNPYWVLEGSSILAGESANDFILRNTNLNPNELSIQAVANFTENALRLPTLASVNDNFRGF